jgi:UDP-N-acetylmuramate-alanine ligase
MRKCTGESDHPKFNVAPATVATYQVSVRNKTLKESARGTGWRAVQTGRQARWMNTRKNQHWTDDYAHQPRHLLDALRLSLVEAVQQEPGGALIKL